MTGALLPRGRDGYAIAAALSLLVLAVYGRTLAFPFVAYDDQDFLVGNPAVQEGLTWASARWALVTDMDAGRIPLTWLSRLVDVSLFGMDARGHHGVNVALHLASVLLCFRFLEEATGRRWESAFAAALFAVHPLHVESVAWVTERKDVLSGLFWFLSLTAYVRWTRSPSRGRYALLLLLFFLSLASKPIAVTLPFVLLLLDFWPLWRLRLPSAGSAPPAADGEEPWRGGGAAEGNGLPWRRLLLEKAPLFALSAAASVVTAAGEIEGGATPSIEAIPLGARLGNAVLSYRLQIRHALWPSDLAAFYPHPGSSPSAAAVAASLLLLAFATILAWREKGRRPWLLVGWLWFAGVLVPVSGLVQTGGYATGDRFMYLPSTGLYVAAAWGGAEGLRRLRLRPAAAGGPAAAVLLLLAALSFVQAGYWRGTEPLFRRALEVTRGNWMAHLNLGIAARDEGRMTDAEGHFREVVRILPSLPEGHGNLAVVLSMTGRTAEAEEQFREALLFRPGSAEPLAAYGVHLARNGRDGEAEARYREALAADPACWEALQGLAVVTARRGDLEGAVSRVREAVRLRPRSAEARNNLGVLLARSGRREEAEASFREALSLRPGYEGARRNLDRLRGGHVGGFPGGEP
jgi:Flp pilus assembly protein TadD